MTVERITAGPGLPGGFPFPDPARAPSRLTFKAGALPSGAKIEFQAVAATP
jgi:hypothetical protein